MLTRNMAPILLIMLVAAECGQAGFQFRLCREPETAAHLEASLHFGKLFQHQTQHRKETKQMSNTIILTASSSKPHAFNGPVAVAFSIANNSAEPASVLLPYPNPNNLSFRCASSDFALPKQVESDSIERTAPTIVKPGAKHTVTYYLNRYFKFPRTGRGKFQYELTAFINFGDKGAPKLHTFNGAFEVELIAASDEELRKEFAARSEQLQSNDRQAKLEAAESLAFIDSPIVVPYLLALLRLDNFEVTGIQALGRHPSPESEAAITSMLAHPDSAVVSAALTEIERIKIPIQRQKIQSLLASQNPNVRWTALKWLASRPDRQDLPFVQLLLSDANEAVKKEAARYADLLQRPK